MLRMRWNLRMSSLPASSARPVASRTTHAALLSAAPVMCFMSPSLSVPPGTDFPGLTRCGATDWPAPQAHCRGLRARRARAEQPPCRDLGPGSAMFVTGLAGGGTGLPVIMDHVLADGIAGLA